jgi:hypothetical protein
VPTFNFFSACVDLFEAKLTAPRQHGIQRRGRGGQQSLAEKETALSLRTSAFSAPSALESFFYEADSTSTSFGCGFAALGHPRSTSSVRMDV